MIKSMEQEMELNNLIMAKTSELRVAFRKQLGLMSYYNAAEGMYSMEKNARDECRRKLLTLATLLKEDGFSEDGLKELTKDFMVSERDYLPRKEAML